MGAFKSFHYHTASTAAAPVPAADFDRGMGGFNEAMAGDREEAAGGFDESMAESAPEVARGFPPMAAPPADIPRRAFHNDEAAARSFMDDLWVQQAEGPFFEITAPESAAIVPDLRFVKSQESPSTNTRLLHFNQTNNNVSVFGAKAIVEMTPGRELMSIEAQIADAPGVSPIATLSPAQALAKVAEIAGVDPATLGNVAPALAYYKEEAGTWHLAFKVRDVGVAPKEFLESVRTGDGHGLGASPRQETLQMTYLVDAHNGAILLYYSQTPWLDLPTECVGLDELRTAQKFFAVNNGAAFELRDPVRKIRTLDLGGKNLKGAALPATPVANPEFDFQATNTAAISAHVNAMRVFDFFNDVLKRDGVDDQGMELVSIVNCTYQPPDSAEWKNAVWYQQRMWYGQVKNAEGGFDSYSRHLDVIAHELSHGVTESTAGLVYLNESGALNESFSDIFGIIVKNLNGPSAADFAGWDWELGRGLRKDGGALRNLRDPKSAGYPDHMDDYQKKPAWNDSGGVHTNSNIHNKAAFNVMVSKDAADAFVFTPEEAALLYYLTLSRLTSLAEFSDVLATMQNVVKTLYAGRPELIDTKTKAIVAAYDAVGIKVPE